MPNPPLKKQLNIELGENEGQGIYSNLVIITHSPSEFIVDFARILPGLPKSKIYSRIIMTPIHAKSLLKTLEENIKRFEKQFGEIPNIAPNQQQHTQPIGFKSND